MDKKKQANFFIYGLKLFLVDQLKLPWGPYVSIILYRYRFSEPYRVEGGLGDEDNT